jgi:hypothetical protein
LTYRATLARVKGAASERGAPWRTVAQTVLTISVVRCGVDAAAAGSVVVPVADEIGTCLSAGAEAFACEDDVVCSAPPLPQPTPVSASTPVSTTEAAERARREILV